MRSSLRPAYQAQRLPEPQTVWEERGLPTRCPHCGWRPPVHVLDVPNLPPDGDGMVDITEHVAGMAEALGLDPDEMLREAQRIVAEQSGDDEGA